MNALRLAVVGHTNVGKTSLLRTLARSIDFGTFADAPATTRRAEALLLFETDTHGRIDLVDTPGLERAGDLLERVEARPGHRDEGWAAIIAVIDDPAQHPGFEQEARVLREVQAADALIVVGLGPTPEEVLWLSRHGMPVATIGARDRKSVV